MTNEPGKNMLTDKPVTGDTETREATVLPVTNAHAERLRYLARHTIGFGPSADACIAGAKALEAHAELLASLIETVRDYELLIGDGVTETNQPLLLVRARAAIAKAEGQ